MSPGTRLTSDTKAYDADIVLGLTTATYDTAGRPTPSGVASFGTRVPVSTPDIEGALREKARHRPIRCDHRHAAAPIRSIEGAVRRCQNAFRALKSSSPEGDLIKSYLHPFAPRLVLLRFCPCRE